MSDIVIAAEYLSKSYLVGHQSAQRESYTALRDVIAREARNFARKTADLVRGRQIVQGDDVEQFWALRDVSFEITQGDIVGIIGRNGAGKSTLLKILSRITEPDRGRAVLRGRVASLLEVGTGFHPELTGRENIFLNGAILGMTRAEIKLKFDEIVAFAEVDRFLDTPVKRYSSGMYVRLAFSIAAHLDAEILVMDEVLAVGDTDFQKKCLRKMDDVARSGRTVVLVSHQLGTLRDLCSRGMILTAGRVSTFDTIEQALREYLNAQTRLEPRSKKFRYVTDVRDGNDSKRQFHLFFGDPLVIKATLKNLPEVRSGFTVAIKNPYGKRVSLFSTNPHDGISLPSGGTTEVTFTIDFCPYAPGEYYVDLALTEPDVRIIEEFANALKFEVLPARRNGTLAYGAPYGEFFPAHAWNIVPQHLGHSLG